MVADLEEGLEEDSLAAVVGPQETERLRLDALRPDDLADIVFLADRKSVV